MTLTDKQASMQTVLAELNKLYLQLLTIAPNTSGKELANALTGLYGYVYGKFSGITAAAKDSVAVAKQAIDLLDGTDKDSAAYKYGLKQAVLDGDEAAWSDWLGLAESSMGSMRQAIGLVQKYSFSSFLVQVGNNLSDEVKAATPSAFSLGAIAVILVAIFLILLIK